MDTQTLLSTLPPGIRHLLGPVTWVLDDENCEPTEIDDAVYAIRRSFAHAPATLETIVTGSSLRWATDSELKSSSYEYWLPRSLTTVDWTQQNCPRWAPTLARSMPSTLSTLSLGSIDSDSYRSHKAFQWVEDLPRSLTSLTIANEENGVSNELISYGHCLPRGLTALTLFGTEDSKGAFGDWSTITGINYWPPNLTTLHLDYFWIEPSEIANLPKTVQNLTIYISSSQNGSSLLVLRTALLPPSLVHLDLKWTSEIDISLSLDKHPLRTCRLVYEGITNWPLPFEQLQSFPDSLTDLEMCSINLISPRADLVLPKDLLPKLQVLRVHQASCELFELVPRALQTLAFSYISDLDKSPLLVDGQLFKHLPTSLRQLQLLEHMYPPKFELPPQEFGHLPNLVSLILRCTPKVSSTMIRKLPRGLLHLQACIKVESVDLPFLPPGLMSCHLDLTTTQLVEYLPLRALARFPPFNATRDMRQIAHERVRHAIKHP